MIMKKIMFVCHGNICRSPMAEFVFKDMVDKAGLSSQILTRSSATSREEIGSDIHYGTREKLLSENIPFEKRQAIQFTKKDYTDFDYILVMDSQNIRNIMKIIGSDEKNKVFRLLDFSLKRDIADPWYSGDFNQTFYDIKTGCRAFLEFLITDKI